MRCTDKSFQFEEIADEFWNWYYLQYYITDCDTGVDLIVVPVNIERLNFLLLENLSLNV